MKNFVCLLLLLLLHFNNGYSQHQTTNQGSSTSNSQESYYPLLLDPGLTMRIGTENMTTVHKGLFALEDRLLGTNWFPETNAIRKTGGMIGRFAKYSFLDMPVDYFSVVLGHEFFGHGARYRELDMDGIQYGFDFPPPYGKGGGEATNNKNVSISNHELLAIWEGGIEMHPIINRTLAMRWMSTQTIHYREASLYFWSFQIMMNYVQGTNENLGDGTKDDDPRAYTRFININAGYEDLQALKMSVKDLKSKMVVNAINPFVYYSLFSILKTYLWDGNETNKIPALKFGSTRYLPGLRTGLTPFGVEFHFENYIQNENITALVDLKYGDQSFHDFWGGIGVYVLNAYKISNFSFDANIDIWAQPKIQLGINPTTNKGGGLGGAFSSRAYYDFPNAQIPLSAVVELGYKSVGFLDGYALDSSPILAVGLAIKR